MKRRLLRWILYAAAAALLIGGIVWGWTRFKDGGGADPTYLTTAVKRGDITQAVTATGQINPQVTVQVGSQVSGMIQHIYVDFNSPVKAGQVVAEMDPSLYKADVAKAQGDLANASADVELTRQINERTKKLRLVDSASDEDVETAEANFNKAEAMVKLKQGDLDKATANLAYCKIHSPVDGTVISRNVDVGQTVASNFNAPVLFNIANDLRVMQIDANVAEADVGNVTLGLDVNFYVDAYPNRVFKGKVLQIRNAPLIVQNVVTYDVVIDVNNSDLLLKPGMTANVSIVIAQKQGVLQIPNSALRFRMPKVSGAAEDDSQNAAHASKKENPNVRSVFVISEGNRKPGRVKITLGISDGINTEVTEGLKESDKVVIGTTGGKPGGLSQGSNPLAGGGQRRF